MIVTPNQLHILQHALGLNEYGQGESYRTHFVTGDGSDDHADCVALTVAGFMTRRSGNAATGDMDLFNVTEAGRAQVAAQSPAPPKLTRSQRRYRDWLAADCNMTFGEWIAYTSRRVAA